MTISFTLFSILLGIGAANARGNITQCDKCFNDNYALCQNDTEIQNCTFPATDSCFTVAGRYKFRGSEVVLAGVARGCGSCPNETEGCKNFKQFFEASGKLTLVDCNIECCSSNRCNKNTHVPWLLSPATTATPSTVAPSTVAPSTVAPSTVAPSTATAGHPSRFSFTTGGLAIAAIFGVFFLFI